MGKHISSRMSCLSTVLLSVMHAASAHATLRLGKVVIIPFIEAGAFHDSNVLRGAAPSTASSGRKFSPGVRLRFTDRASELQLDYKTETLSYAEAPSVNDSVNTSSRFSADAALPVGLRARLTHQHTLTSDPLNSELIERVRHHQNTAAAALATVLSRRFAGTVRYSQTLYHFIPDDIRRILDRRESDINAELDYVLSPRLFLLVNGGAGSVDYADDAAGNSSRHTDVRAGVEGELTAKTSCQLKAGAKHRIYDDPAKGEVTLPVVSFTGETRFSAMTALRVQMRRDLVESSFTGNSYYVANVLSMTLVQRIYRPWQVSITGGYENGEYPRPAEVDGAAGNRSDAVVRGSLEILYHSTAFEWLILGGSVVTVRRTSNFPRFGYTDAVSSFGARVEF